MIPGALAWAHGAGLGLTWLSHHELPVRSGAGIGAPSSVPAPYFVNCNDGCLCPGCAWPRGTLRKWTHELHRERAVSPKALGYVEGSVMHALHQRLASLGQGAQGVGTEGGIQPGQGVGTLIVFSRATRRPPWGFGGGSGCCLAQGAGGCWAGQCCGRRGPAAASWSHCPSPWRLQGPLNPLKEASRCDGAWQGRGTGDDNAYTWGHCSGTLLGSWAQPLAGPQTCLPGLARRQALSAQSRVTRPHEGPLGPGSSRWHGAPPCPDPDIWAAAVLWLGCHDNVGQFPDRRGTGSRGPTPQTSEEGQDCSTVSFLLITGSRVSSAEQPRE